MPIKQTGGFKFWVKQALPNIYSDALSYYELLEKVIEYLNSVIEQNNAVTDYVEENVLQQDTLILALRNEFESVRDDVLPENLEILLDEWFLNGKLQTIINTTLYDEIDTRYNGIVQQLIGKTDKGGVSVYDINKDLGKFDQTYMTDDFLQQIVGTAPINSVPADGSITPIKTTFFKPAKNLFNKGTSVNGFYVNQLTGVLTAGETHDATDFIEVEPALPYICNQTFQRYAWYDANNVFISGGVGNYAPITSPSNAKLLVASCDAWDIHTLQIEQNSVITDFEEFKFIMHYDLMNIEPLETRVTEIENTVSVTSTPVTSTLMNTIFSGATLPNRFVNNGFTINNGAKSPTTGGWDKHIYWDSYSTLDELSIRARVKINATGCNFALLKRDKRNIASTIGQVDTVNKKLILRELWNNNTATIPNVVVEGVIPFDFVIGREYLIELNIQTVKITVLRITDGITGELFEITNDYAVTNKRTSGWGSVGVVAINGDFTIKKLDYVNNQPSTARLAIYGDSFIEGDSMMAVGHTNRYASKLKEDLAGDVLICGRGGETSAGLILKFDDDFLNFKPTYTLLAIGTNQDSSIAATWITNIQTLIELVESRGSIPILMTLTVNTAGANWVTYMTDINNWIMNSGLIADTPIDPNQ